MAQVSRAISMRKGIVADGKRETKAYLIIRYRHIHLSYVMCTALAWTRRQRMMLEPFVVLIVGSSTLLRSISLSNFIERVQEERSANLVAIERIERVSSTFVHWGGNGMIFWMYWRSSSKKSFSSICLDRCASAVEVNEHDDVRIMHVDSSWCCVWRNHCHSRNPSSEIGRETEGWTNEGVLGT